MPISPRLHRQSPRPPSIRWLRRLAWLALLASGCSRTAATEAGALTSSDGAGAPDHGSSAVGTATAADGPRLRLMTYNVNYGLAGDADTTAAIADGAADIVLLQETTAGWEAHLRAELGDRYPFQEYRHCCLAGGLGVLSRRPFETRELTHPDGAWFPSWRVIADTPLGRLQLLNVHLRPNVSDDGSYIKGLLSTPAVRESEIAEHAAVLEPSLPTVVAGDFNEGDGGRALRWLGWRGLHSVLPRFAGRQDTWRWTTSLGTLEQQFDHVVIDGQLVAVHAQVMEQGRSDHLPVVVELGRVAAR
jgi:endonuclease/exonuclease/phosphatase (EEP) superfamily protein YafD